LQTLQSDHGLVRSQGSGLATVQQFGCRVLSGGAEGGPAKHGTPEIFNADQGSRFTSGDWIDLLMDAKVKISMDGKGRWIDNLTIKRLSRSLKYECVYLLAFEKGSEAKVGIRAWLTYSKARRPHSAHRILTHDGADAGKIKLTRLAA
jgi:putative transposase